MSRAANEDVTLVATAPPARQVMEESKGQVWEFDPELEIEHRTNMEYAEIKQLMAVPCCFLCALGNWITFEACGKENLAEQIRGKHLVVTDDNIEFTQDSYYGTCRLECDHHGRYTKTVPIDRVQDIAVHEPAGYATSCFGVCCVVKETLTTASIQTAGSSGAPELKLSGLRDAVGFRKEILRLKKGESGDAVISSQPAWVGPPAAAATAGGGEAQAELLALGRQQLELLQSIDASLKKLATAK